jgi:hypothetical protein
MQDEIRAYLHGEQALGPIQSVVVTRFGVRESIGKRSTPLARFGVSLSGCLY